MRFHLGFLSGHLLFIIDVANPILLGLALRLAVFHVFLVFPLVAESRITLVCAHLSQVVSILVPLSSEIGSRGRTYHVQVCIILVVNLIYFIGLYGFGRRRKKLVQCIVCRIVLQPSVIGKLDINKEIQVSLVLTPLHRHTLPFDSEAVARSQNLAPGSLDVNAAPIEVLDDCS